MPSLRLESSMAEIAVPVVVFGIILAIALVLIFAMLPTILNKIVDAIKQFIRKLGCEICKRIPMMDITSCGWKC